MNRILRMGTSTFLISIFWGLITLHSIRSLLSVKAAKLGAGVKDFLTTSHCPSRIKVEIKGLIKSRTDSLLFIGP